MDASIRGIRLREEVGMLGMTRSLQAAALSSLSVKRTNW